MMAVMRFGNVVEIEWVDSFSSATWDTRINHERSARGSDQMVHRSVGYFLSQSDTSVTIAQSMAEDDGDTMVGDALTIPRRSIDRIRVLER